MHSLTLLPERESSLLRRHPWVFAGALVSPNAAIGLGETVLLTDSQRQPLALAAYSPHSQIRARVWSFDPKETISPEFLRARLARAISRRESLLTGARAAARLVHAESDGLPGIIVDQYADTLSVQLLSAGAEFWRETLFDLLMELTGAARLYERSDAEVRKLEGLPPRVQLARGNAAGRAQIDENGLRFWVDLEDGHKTGFYLDQRANRALVRELAGGCEVLDCFAYTGGFTLAALKGGANSVTTVDSSAPALALAVENLSLNEIPPERAAFLEADVFQQLRKFRDQNRSFDLIILDPPKFAPTAAHVKRAARAYKDINLLAFKLLRRGGRLVTFSCSGGVSADLFQKIVAGAAFDAGVDAQIERRLWQDVDHATALNFPEGEYLKGLVLRI